MEIKVRNESKLVDILSWLKAVQIAFKSGDYNEVMNGINKLLRDPNCDQLLLPNEKEALIWGVKGAAALTEGRCQEAIDHFNQVLVINLKNSMLSDLKNALVWHSKGFALATMGRYEEAIQCFDQLLRIDPENVFASQNREKALSKKAEVTKEKLFGHSVHPAVIFKQLNDNTIQTLQFSKLREIGHHISLIQGNDLRGFSESYFEFLKQLPFPYFISSVSCIAAVSNEQVVIGNLTSGALSLWDLTRKIFLQTFQGHTDSVNSVAVTSKGQIVSGSRDNTIRLWNPATGACLRTFQGHRSSVEYVMVTPGDQIVSRSRDKTVKLWDPDSGVCIQTFGGHKEAITCISMYSLERIITGSYDGTLKIWDLMQGTCLQTLQVDRNVSCLAVLSKDMMVVGHCRGPHKSTLKVWDLAKKTCVRVLETRGFISDLSILSNGYVLVKADRGLELWDSVNWVCLNDSYVRDRYRHDNRIQCASFAILPNRQVVSATRLGYIGLWDPSPIIPLSQREQSELLWVVLKNKSITTLDLSGIHLNSVKLPKVHVNSVPLPSMLEIFHRIVSSHSTLTTLIFDTSNMTWTQVKELLIEIFQNRKIIHVWMDGTIAIMKDGNIIGSAFHPQFKTELLEDLKTRCLAIAEKGDYVESVNWQKTIRMIDSSDKWEWQHGLLPTLFKASVDRYSDDTKFYWPTEKWHVRNELITLAADGTKAVIEQLCDCLERVFKLKFLMKEGSVFNNDFKEMIVPSDPESPEEKLIDNLLAGWSTLTPKTFEAHQRVIECVVACYQRQWREECWLELDKKGLNRILELLITSMDMLTTPDEQTTFLKLLNKIQTSISPNEKPGVGIKPRLTYQLGHCPRLYGNIHVFKEQIQLSLKKANPETVFPSVQLSAEPSEKPIQEAASESPTTRQRTTSREKSERKHLEKKTHRTLTEIRSDWMISRTHYELKPIEETRLEEFRSIIQAAMSNFLSAVKTVSSDKVDPNASFWASSFDSMVAFSAAFIPCAGPALSAVWGAIRPATYFSKENQKDTYKKLSDLIPLPDDVNKFIIEFSSLITAYYYTEILIPSQNRTYMERIKDFMSSGTVWEGFKGYINTKIEEYIIGVDDKVEDKQGNYKAHWPELISYIIGSFLVNLNQLSFEDVQNNTLAVKLSAPFTPISSDPLTFNAKANEFDFTNAHMLVRLSFLAYETEQKIDQLARLWGYNKKAGEKRYQFIFENDFQAFMLADREKICVVFRGTATVVNALTDMHIHLSKGKTDSTEINIHTGFMNSVTANWHRIKPFIEQAKKEAQKYGHQPSIWFTGHSLGGALATMAAFRYLIEEETAANHIHLYTYGQPRCGNSAFANYMNQHIKDYQRFVNYLDPFTEVPFEWMGYAHAGHERWIDVKGNLHDKASHEVEIQKKDCYGQGRIRDNLFTRKKHLWDHSVYLEKIGKIVSEKGELVYNFAEYVDVEFNRSRLPMSCTNFGTSLVQDYVGVSAENVPQQYVKQEEHDKVKVRVTKLEGEIDTVNQALTKVQLELEKEKKEKIRFQKMVVKLGERVAVLEKGRASTAALLLPQLSQDDLSNEDNPIKDLLFEPEPAPIQDSSEESIEQVGDNFFPSVLSQPGNFKSEQSLVQNFDPKPTK